MTGARDKDSYTFVCNKHSEATGQFHTKVKASARDPDILLERDCNAPKLLPKRRKTGKSSSEPDRDFSQLPSYVEFEGSFFHIAEFLSLQEGKVHRPQTSRISSWMASSQSDFYEQIDKLISPERTQNGLYLDDFGSFRVPNSGLNIGQIIRILWCPSYKSSYPVFEWKDNPQEKGKTSICIRIWTHIEVGLKWKLHPQNANQWCDPNTLLEKYHAGDSDTEKFIDPSKLKLMLPRLEKLEDERLQKQRRAKEQERQEVKKGAPENLSKELLKEILTEHGITFKKSATKMELINKVLDFRRQLQQQANVTTEMENDGRETVGEIEVTHLDEPISDFAFMPIFNQSFHKTSETEQKSAHKKAARAAKSRMISCVLYFFDEEHERKLIIMLHIVFLLALFSLFLDFSMVHYITVLLHSLIYQASGLSAVECLVYATLKAHYNKKSILTQLLDIDFY